MNDTVKLLDNIDYQKDKLLKDMIEDDFYYNNMNVKKVLSYSSAKWLLKSPKYFLEQFDKPMKETQALRDGKLIHTYLLEPLKYKNLTFIDTSSKATKVWKEAVAKFGAENTYTTKEKYINRRVTKSFIANNICRSYINESETEVPGIITVDNIPFRGKADLLGEDYVADVKTTNDGVAELNLGNGTTKNQFEYAVSKYDYDMQAYLYTIMFNKPRFIWLVIDKVTLDVGVFEASKELLERGKAKLDQAIELYGTFFVDKLIDLDQYHITKTI